MFLSGPELRKIAFSVAEWIKVTLTAIANKFKMRNRSNVLIFHAGNVQKRCY